MAKKIIRIFALLIAITYGSGFVYSQKRFLPNTYVDGVGIFRKTYSFQNVMHFFHNLRGLLATAAEAKGYILLDIHHREKCKMLKNKVNRPLVRRNVCHILSADLD